MRTYLRPFPSCPGQLSGEDAMVPAESVCVCERGRRKPRASLSASLALENLKLGGYLHCVG
jgi:hypothetical protein